MLHNTWVGGPLTTDNTADKISFQSFRFPLFVSIVHYTVVFALAALVRLVMEVIKKKKRVIISWGPYFKRIFPPGMMFTLNFVLACKSKILKLTVNFTINQFLIEFIINSYLVFLFQPLQAH